DRALAIELDIFERLAATVTDGSASIKRAAEALATIDVATSLAALSLDRDYVRPEVIDSLEFVIEGGRHPVLDQALAREGGPFVATDCDLAPPSSVPAPALAGEGSQGGGRIWIVTGPNMAGKSTFLRQNALIAVLAQMGSFVPARRARIGIVDR